MNCSRHVFTSIRTYATKSKTTNLKWKPSVPVQQTTLSDGSIFIARQPLVEPSVQADVAPLINKASAAVAKKLSEAEITQMRQLREADPSTWTRSKLAKKFGCSELFVSMAAPTKVTVIAEDQAQSVAKHGYRRALITQERQKRKALW
ncbi:hypothetical protein INT47_000385 [Mucor saturninus]|uniref:Uncharacterized protein n=1 Tax=Mucor saturninus TaxID=64648 RepID=A0A8H7QT83_9FUNG|nr:hypothetical protein INT47_000385 [Mucor saturninus]